MRVADICRLQNGNGFRPEQWASSGYPIIRIQNLNGNRNFNYFAGTPADRWLVRPGQMLFAWAGTKGASFGPTIWKGEVGVLNQHIFKVHPKPGVDNDWLYLALSHITRRIEAGAHGFKATLVHVKKSEIDDQEIGLPPLLEQRRIAEVLSTWDQAIAAAEALWVNARTQKSALMRSLLTGSVRLPGFTGAWQQRPIREISTSVKRRNDGSPLPILTIASTAGFVRQDEKYSRFMAGKSVETYTLLSEGEFAYNKGNSKTYEFGCVFDLNEYERALVPNVYVCFALRRGYDRAFYRALFEADYLAPQLGRLVNTGVRNNGLLNITASQFLGVLVPTPPLEEQEALAAVMETASAEVKALQAQLLALKEEKAALLQQLLTGKRRVRVAESEAA